MMIDKLDVVAHRVRCATQCSAPNSGLELTKPPANANTEGFLVIECDVRGKLHHSRLCATTTWHSDGDYVRHNQTMGFGTICNTWQTCLRPVWARRGPCLRLADRLSRGKHLGISSISFRLLVVAQKIKSQEIVAVLASSAQSIFTLLQLLPLVVSLAF
jgi:hypothetical protein